MSKQIVILVLAIGSVIAFWLIRKYRTAPDLDIEHLSLTDLNGNEFDATQLRGKTIFVNYWATWCPDCLREMPSIETAFYSVDTNSVVFLMISDESSEKIQEFQSKHNYPMKFIRSTKRLQELGITTWPTTYIFDDEGYEAYTHVGAADWADEGMIQLLKRP